MWREVELYLELLRSLRFKSCQERWFSSLKHAVLWQRPEFGLQYSLQAAYSTMQLYLGIQHPLLTSMSNYTHV